MPSVARLRIVTWNAAGRTLAGARAAPLLKGSSENPV